MQVFNKFNVKSINNQSMNCQMYQKHFLSYLDGELHRDMAKQLDDHIKSCESCRVEVERLKIVYNLIEIEKAEFKPDPFMSARVVAKLTDKQFKSSNSRSLRYFTIASLAAAGIAIGIVIGTLYSSTLSIPENLTAVQEWDQLADEYMPETENNPYNMATITNETPTKP